MRNKIIDVLKFLKIILITLILLTITIPWLISTSKAQKYDYNFKPYVNSKFIVIDNVTLHYRFFPSKDSIIKGWILFVHGMGGSTYSWEKNCSFFSDKSYNVIAVDIPPFGYSDKNPELNNSIDVISRLLWKLIKNLDDKSKWILVGHSMGGGIVQCMAIMKPKKTQKVIFVAPALFKQIKPQKKFNNLLLKIPLIQRIMVISAENFLITEKRIKKLLYSSFADTVPDITLLKEYHKALSQKGFALAFIKTFAASTPLENIDGLKFNTPSILFYGDKDTWVPFENIKPIVNELKSIKTIKINQAGHSLMETHYTEFNKVMLDFIENK